MQEKKFFYIIIAILMLIIGVLLGIVINNKESTINVKLSNDQSSIEKASKSTAEINALAYIDNLEKELLLISLNNQSQNLNDFNGVWKISELTEAGIKNEYVKDGKITLNDGSVVYAVLYVDKYELHYNDGKIEIIKDAN